MTSERSALIDDWDSDLRVICHGHYGAAVHLDRRKREMPGIVCSASEPEDAMEELRIIVADIQRRENGGEVEVLDPPYIGIEWQMFAGGKRTRTIERGEAVAV